MGADKKRKQRSSQFDVGAAVKALRQSVNGGTMDDEDEDNSDDDDDEGTSHGKGSSMRHETRGGDNAQESSEDYGDGSDEEFDTEDDDDMLLDENEASDGGDDEEAQRDTSMALAEAMGKVLSKNVAKTTPILSKTGGGGVEKIIAGERQAELAHRLKVKRTKMLQQIGRIKPTHLGSERDRKLSRLATRGAVQLFNAVNDQQKLATAEKTKVASKLLTTKKERQIKDMSKEKFLSMLTTKTTGKGKPVEVEEGAADAPAHDGPAYMRDDFMMTAKAKDWGKDDKDDEALGTEVGGELDDDDSDDNN